MALTGSSGFARNVLSNWALLLANVAYGLTVTPVIVGALRPDGYGVWTFLNGLLAYSELFYFGLGSALIRYTAAAVAANDERGLARLVSVVLTLYLTIGLAVLMASVGVGGMVGEMFAQPLDAQLAREAAVICVCLGFRLLLAFVASAFAGLISGLNRFDVVSGVGLAFVVVKVVVFPLAVRGESPMLALGLATVLVALVETVVVAASAYRLHPALKVTLVRPSSAELRMLYGFGLQSFFIVFAARLIGQTDTIVVGAFLGAASAGVYGLSQTLIDYSRTAVGGASGVLLPSIVALKAQARLDEIKRQYLRVTRLGGVLACSLAATVITVGPTFLSVWVGRDYAAPSRQILIPLSAALVLNAWASQLPLAFYQSLHLLRIPALVLMVEATMNLALSLILAPRMGLLGVSLGTMVPAFLSFACLPRVLCRRLGVSQFDYLLSGVGPGLVCMLVVGSFNTIILSSVTISGMFGVAAVSVAGLVVGFGATWCVLPKGERQIVRQTLSNGMSAVFRVVVESR